MRWEECCSDYLRLYYKLPEILAASATILIHLWFHGPGIWEGQSRNGWPLLSDSLSHGWKIQLQGWLSGWGWGPGVVILPLCLALAETWDVHSAPPHGSQHGGFRVVRLLAWGFWEPEANELWTSPKPDYILWLNHRSHIMPRLLLSAGFKLVTEVGPEEKGRTHSPLSIGRISTAGLKLRQKLQPWGFQGTACWTNEIRGLLLPKVSLGLQAVSEGERPWPWLHYICIPYSTQARVLAMLIIIECFLYTKHGCLYYF